MVELTTIVADGAVPTCIDTVPMLLVPRLSVTVKVNVSVPVKG